MVLLLSWPHPTALSGLIAAAALLSGSAIAARTGTPTRGHESRGVEIDADLNREHESVRVVAFIRTAPWK